MKKLIITILLIGLISIGYSDSLYRPAVKAGNFLYISGQNAQTHNESLKGENITQQTQKAILLIQKTLKKHGYSLNDIIDVNVAIAKQQDFDAFNKEYKKYFPNKPARSTALGVLHQNIGALVEISAIAYKK
ncbi:RidA family protein [Francisella sp. 19X1-34]|uniref:RidA family protein n=1 Tax=Francisella sp. 19X1-34 TaxID=3087177 RepID=UPI002E31C757|nr:RidA family protein [Francisella sp. 19X1-34]MED7787610.1 RidA family protein [Francisella sp. 19X1-34]